MFTLKIRDVKVVHLLSTKEVVGFWGWELSHCQRSLDESIFNDCIICWNHTQPMLQWEWSSLSKAQFIIGKLQDNCQSSTGDWLSINNRRLIEIRLPKCKLITIRLLEQKKLALDSNWLFYSLYLSFNLTPGYISLVTIRFWRFLLTIFEMPFWILKIWNSNPSSKFLDVY